jgi:uncharacterized protein
LILLPLTAWSAGFDCQKARSATEKTICADAELSRLDSQLAQTYHDALQANDKNGKNRLLLEQKNWLTYVRNSCLGAACLREAYQSRIQLLTKHPSPFDIPTSFMKVDVDGTGLPLPQAIDYARDPKEYIDEFNKALTGNSKFGEIIGCGKAITISSGNHDQIDYTIAGICTFKNKQQTLMQICYVHMGGDNPVVQITDETDASYEKLINFAINKCL